MLCVTERKLNNTKIEKRTPKNKDMDQNPCYHGNIKTLVLLIFQSPVPGSKANRY